MMEDRWHDKQVRMGLLNNTVTRAKGYSGAEVEIVETSINRDGPPSNPRSSDGAGDLANGLTPRLALVMNALSRRR
jgi:hypothetical protein